ncbi:MAG: translation initiation factor IF-2, partial [Candidatus Anstonellaceae archaeon]
QMIGAYYLPKQTIIELSGELGEKLKTTLKVPGILFIDTPGHEAFTSMRQRGGSISDIAILLIDITQGVQPQTLESLEILVANKIPFLIALNKIDLLEGWKAQPTTLIEKSILSQNQKTIEKLEEKTYSILAEFNKHGLKAERFDRVSDFTKEIIAIPCSAKTGEGTAELLLYLVGLSQKYLSGSLDLRLDIPAKGSILEVKEEKGLGTTIDVIIYEGTLKKNDSVVFASLNGPMQTKVRGILRPPFPNEKVQTNQKYIYIEEAVAAAGIKIYAPNLEGALAGSPIYALENEKELERISKELDQTISSILIKKDLAGIIVKTDTLGSAEAFLSLLKAKNIPIREIGIGQITKKDVIDAYTTSFTNKYLGVILGFNVSISKDALEEIEKKQIKVFNSKIIYESFENYLRWVEEEKLKDQEQIICSITYPVKIKVLPNCFFRLCKPAIFGVEILTGKLKPKTILCKSDGLIIGEVKTIQSEGQAVSEALPGQRVAISLDECICGKTIKELDVLFSFILKEQRELLKNKCSNLLSGEELALLDEIEKIIKK